MKKNNSGEKIMRRNSGSALAFGRMMQCRNIKNAIVYVEGESDKIFYQEIVDDEYVQLQYMEGKDAAIDAIEKANRFHHLGQLALVDSDFDNIFGVEYQKNIIRTDTHDIETLMLREGIFKYSARSYADENQMLRYGIGYDDICKSIIEIGYKIGKLRLISKEKGLFLNFKGAENILERDDLIKIENKKIEFNLRQYIWECVNATTNAKFVFKEIYDLFAGDKREFDPWQICRGHDLCLIISILYSKDKLGHSYINRSTIERDIRSSYLASRRFKKTTMFSDIKEWQKKNINWKILNDEYN